MKTPTQANPHPDKCEDIILRASGLTKYFGTLAAVREPELELKG